MKRNMLLRLGVVLSLVFICGISLYAQDGRIPGDEAMRVPLGIEARNGKLVFESKDTTFQWWFDSRIQVDGAMYFENKNSLSNGALLRRITFAMKTILWKNWRAELDIDFREDASINSQVELRDTWIQYEIPNKNIAFQIGNFKEPFGLEELNSSRLLTMMERSGISKAIPLGRRLGFVARYWTDWGQATVGIFGHEAGARVDKGQNDEGYSTNLRLSVAPFNQPGQNLHLGVAASYKRPDVTADLALNTIEVKTRNETYVSDIKYLHTGDITSVNYYNRFAGELMGVYGPFFIQSEYMFTDIHRWYGKPTVNLGGGYVTLSWMTTGESRKYYVDEGEMGPIDSPKHSWGALELAARYSITDLNDEGAGIKGGLGKFLTFGVNYYPNVNLKIMLNYVIADFDDNATGKGKYLGNDDHSFLQMRIQASF
jgi:phosphate-selective porin OprO and OprP